MYIFNIKVHEDFKNRLLFRVFYLNTSQKAYIENLIREDLGDANLSSFFKRDQWTLNRDYLGWNNKKYWTKTGEAKEIAVRLDYISKEDLLSRLKDITDVGEYIVSLIDADLDTGMAFNKNNCIYTAYNAEVKHMLISTPMDLNVAIKHRIALLDMSLNDYIYNILKEKIDNCDMSQTLKRDMWFEQKTKYLSEIPESFKYRTKNMGCRVPAEFYRRMKETIIGEDTTIKDLVIKVITKDIAWQDLELKTEEDVEKDLSVNQDITM